jgi:hypothetical protein
MISSKYRQGPSKKMIPIPEENKIFQSFSLQKEKWKSDKDLKDRKCEPLFYAVCDALSLLATMENKRGCVGVKAQFPPPEE